VVTEGRAHGGLAWVGALTNWWTMAVEARLIV